MDEALREERVVSGCRLDVRDALRIAPHVDRRREAWNVCRIRQIGRRGAQFVTRDERSHAATLTLFGCYVKMPGAEVIMSGFADYEQYDATGLAELVRKKLVTADELLDAAIERVEARNGAVNAVVMPLYDYGRKAIADG